jgi:hypothetical protein
MKVTLSNNLGDGPSIDAMVDASKEYEEILNRHTQAVVRKNYKQFINRK